MTDKEWGQEPTHPSQARRNPRLDNEAVVAYRLEQVENQLAGIRQDLRDRDEMYVRKDVFDQIILNIRADITKVSFWARIGISGVVFPIIATLIIALMVGR